MFRRAHKVVLSSILVVAVSLLAACKTYSYEELLEGAGCERGRTLHIAYVDHSRNYARFRLTNVGSKSFDLYVEVDGEGLEPYWHGISADLQRMNATGAWVSDSAVIDHKVFPEQMLRLRPGESDLIVVPIRNPEDGADYRLMVQDEYDECWIRSEPFRIPSAAAQRPD